MDYQNALVTGASSGLGRGLALFFAARGVKVYAAARRLDQLEALQREGQGTIVPVQLDVAQADQAHARIQALDAESGGLDLVIANAGIAEVTSGKRIEWPVVRKVLDVNVTGAAATLVAALPGMVERKRGHLVGVSSIAALVGLRRLAAYSASKAFLTHFLEGLRQDVAPLGIAVTALQPGYIKTDLTAKRKPETMPYLMELDDAVRRMGDAILRREAEYTFPFPLAAAMKTAAMLPVGLRAAAMKRLS